MQLFNKHEKKTCVINARCIYLLIYSNCFISAVHAIVQVYVYLLLDLTIMLFLPYILFIVIQTLRVFLVFGANECGLCISLREIQWFCYSKIIFCFTSISFHFISFHWTVIGLKRSVFLLWNNTKSRYCMYT